MSGDFFLGVDGGGTKTEFQCIDAAGEVLARHIGGACYHLQVGVAGVRDVLAEGLGAICAALGILPAQLTQAFFGLPAFGEDAAVDPQLDALVGALLGHDRYRCGNDMICGWAGSLAGQDGINLVAGTGSIGYGERRGRSARVGGWGELFSDEGSAYWIAIQGLNIFTRMSDGRLPQGPLLGHFRKAFDLRDDIDICAATMGDPPLGRDDIAALAKMVQAAADDGDPAALAIHDRAADELTQMAKALRTALHYETGERTLTSWSGGAVRAGSGVAKALRQRLAASGDFDPVEPRHSPAYGAALYARAMA